MPQVISVSPTPNENAMKFTLNERPLESGSKTFGDAAAAAAHPIANAIFGLGAIKQVFMVNDFVTVTKLPEADWDDLERKVVAAINGV